MSNVADDSPTVKCQKCMDSGIVKESRADGGGTSRDCECGQVVCTRCGAPVLPPADSVGYAIGEGNVHAGNGCPVIICAESIDLRVEGAAEIAAATEALATVEAERDNALTKLDVANEVIAEVRGVCKAGDDELTVVAVRRVARLAYASEQFIASLAPAVRAPRPTDEAVAAWDREFEAAAVRMPRRKEGDRS